jgi:cyclopropane-fatty-acyl-phospholipid synthase
VSSEKIKSNLKFFKKSKTLPVDKFFKTVLYDKKFGYYSTKKPFGKKGDFITAPKVSYLFSEMIAVWIVSSWELFGKPKNFNIVELGPGDGSLTRILLKSFKKFPEFNNRKKIFLYEESNYLKNIQRKNVIDKKVEWIDNFNKIKKGPVIFFGNEFFDAIPVKQFKKIDGSFFEKNFHIDKDFKIKEIFKAASKSNIDVIKSYKTLERLKFIELPKLGFQELKKISQKISKLSGCILMIDYGYIRPNNQDTLQSVIKHKKNILLNNLGKADVTAHVNFSLLNEFFSKNNLKIKSIITQKKFLENMGILERAKIISKRMNFSEQSDLYFRLRRLLSPSSMGNLFKVILAYKLKKDNFAGF